MAMLACVHALETYVSVAQVSRKCLEGLMQAHKMMGPSTGTFSHPITSISRKNEVMAEFASCTNGL